MICDREPPVAESEKIENYPKPNRPSLLDEYREDQPNLKTTRTSMGEKSTN